MLRFCIFRLSFLLIKIIFPAILCGLIVMRKFLEKNGKNVILGHSALCIVKFTYDLHGALNQKNNSSFDFSLEAILLQCFKNRIV